VARILQHGLRTPESENYAVVETAHTYLPAGAGGGWIDVVPLSGARIALAAGDASSEQIIAATAMGELRSALSALSDLDLPPDELLERLHEVASSPAADVWPIGPAGCVYVVYDPATRVCTASAADHPPPVLIHPSGEVEMLNVPQGPPLGIGLAEYTMLERVLPAGSVLMFYDAALLDDSPGVPRLPLDRLRQIVTAHRGSLQELCDAIVDQLGPKQPQRDVVLLLARTRELDAGQIGSWTLPNEPRVVARARKLATGQLTQWGLDGLGDSAVLVVSELVTNAVRYA
jgi:serine phosphatase RsbU (regulator of sigma subunit)